MKKHFLILFLILICFTTFHNLQAQSKKYFKGCKLDSSSYIKVPTQEEIITRGEQVTLPIRYSNKKYLPKVGDQGDHGTCVGWSSAYYTSTLLFKLNNNSIDSDFHFSPYFLYNNIKIKSDSDCQYGLSLRGALEFMKFKGLLPSSQYQEACASFEEDNDDLLSEALNYRIKDYFRIDKDQMNIKIKKALVSRKAVLIAINTPGSFETNLNHETWDGIIDEFRGGHALSIVGYDDEKEGGAFQIVNSWGYEWGVQGYIWIKYSDLSNIIKEAFEVIGFSSSEYNTLKKRNSFDFSIKIFDDKKRLIEVKQSTINDLFSTSSNSYFFNQINVERKKNEYPFKYGLKINCSDSAFIYVFKKVRNYSKRFQYKQFFINKGNTPYMTTDKSDILCPDDDFFEFYADSSIDKFDQLVFVFSKNELSDNVIEDAQRGVYYNAEDFLVQNFKYQLVFRNNPSVFENVTWELDTNEESTSESFFSISNNPGTIMPLIINVKKIESSSKKK